jgi:hypothetical protein
MNGFAVISKADVKDVAEKTSTAEWASGIKNLFQPYKSNEYMFNDARAGSIVITPKFEKSKVKRAYNIGIRDYGYVLSKDYGFNYNPFFYHSCVIRALDFLTVSLGCDLRLSEIAIADAATLEGKNCFRLLLPIARRIILVTDNRKELQDEVDYAISQFGTSAAVVQDPVKASERADVIIISSDKPHHKYLVEIDKPTLFIRYPLIPKTRWWFDNVGIEFGKNRELTPMYAQGYVDINKRYPIWKNAESDGFRISSLKKNMGNLVER